MIISQFSLIFIAFPLITIFFILSVIKPLIKMKRTKENWKESQPENRNGISGLETFDGEDVKFETRKKHQQEEQKK